MCEKERQIHCPRNGSSFSQSSERRALYQTWWRNRRWMYVCVNCWTMFSVVNFLFQKKHTQQRTTTVFTPFTLWVSDSRVIWICMLFFAVGWAFFRWVRFPFLVFLYLFESHRRATLGLRALAFLAFKQANTLRDV